MAWWNNLSLKAFPFRERKDDPAPASTSHRSKTSRSTMTMAAAMNSQKAMLHPVIFRCVVKICQAVQSVDWHVEADPDVPKKDQLKEADLLKIQAVLNAPTNDHTGGRLRYWMAANYALSSRFAVKVGIGVDGLLNAVYPLRPGHLITRFDAQGVISGYEYGTGEKKVAFLTKINATPDKDLNNRPIKSYAHETAVPILSGDKDDLLNITALGTIGVAAEIITLLMQRAYETASGAANLKHIISAERVMTTDQESELKEFLGESAVEGSESGHILTLTNTKVTVDTLDDNMSDIHTKIPSDDMARHIAGVFGVPISMLGLGAADAAKFANNFAEGRRSFYEDTIIPGYLKPIQESLSDGLCPYGARIRFDYDTIPALEEAKADRAVKLSTVDFLTIEEKRVMCGFPAEGGPAKTEAKTDV